MSLAANCLSKIGRLMCFTHFFRQTVRQAMEMLSGAEMVVRSLIDQGVKQVFGYPGGAVLDIYDALHTVGGIDHVLVRHEQAAVHMADGLARATGEVGVVLVIRINRRKGEKKR